MTTTLTTQGFPAIRTTDGFQRICGKCGGTGIYWKRVADSILTDTTAVAEDCFPCQGTGGKGKFYPTVEDFDKAFARAERARELREEKRKAEAQLQASQVKEVSEPAQPVARTKHLNVQVSETVEVTGTVTKAHQFNGAYGPTVIVILETAQNEAVKMFTSAGWAFHVEEGEEVTVSAIVKGHEEYDGQAQTSLQKPKRIS